MNARWGWGWGWALVLALCAPAASAQDARVEQGKEAFARLCASCHGVEGRGDGPAAAALDPAPADLTRIAARRDGVFPKAEILRIIDGRDPVVAHGSRDMPIWGERFQKGVEPGLAAEAEARGKALLLLEYLRSIQTE